MEDYRQDYFRQKSNAKRRGIEWRFTYESWVEFWGEDINKRGQGHDRLCMQRFGDIGPYSPDNVKKGFPRDNMKTAGVIRRHSNLEKYRAKQQETWNQIVDAVFAEVQHGRG